MNGELRVGFFSRRHIRKGDEITFDYKYERYGSHAQKCFCGAKTCRGWLGGEPDKENKKPGESRVGTAVFPWHMKLLLISVYVCSALLTWPVAGLGKSEDMIVVVTLSCAQCLLFLETFNLEMHHFAIWFVLLICTPFQILFQWKKVMTITGRPRRWRTKRTRSWRGPRSSSSNHSTTTNNSNSLNLW